MTNRHFPVPLDVLEMGQGYFEVNEDYIYRNDEFNTSIIVPKGFITNFYSTPWYVRSIIPKVLSANGPSVVHDYLYSMPLNREQRRIADLILVMAMRDHPTPVPKWRRRLIFRALRLFGRANMPNPYSKVSVNLKEFPIKTEED